jgi:hypothetical protein
LLVSVVLLVLLPRVARAQDEVEVSANLSSQVVEVGEPFVVELNALSGGRVGFSDPMLRLPAGLSAGPPAIGPKMLVQMGTGGSMFRRGITARWRISAGAVGSYTIPPPTVRADGRVMATDNALRVTVVEPGRKPQQHNPFDPFGTGSPIDDPFNDLFNQLNKRPKHDLIVDESVDFDSLGAMGRKLALPRADDAYLFLRLVPDKTSAVIGEQITLRSYQYFRVSNDRTDPREPPLTDFVRVPLDDAPGQSQRVTTSVGGRLWFVVEIDRMAIFPMRAGETHTGTLSAQFRVPYLRNQTISRVSNDVVIDVREPPLAGRPPGYRLGDVGRFDLFAEVTPRETPAGESVSVTVRVEGRGALPPQLKLPERTGVEWLTPVKQDATDVQNGKVGGWRTFGYAVRIVEPGQIDLGHIELPFYDPDQREYRVARVALGKVTARPKKNGTAAAADVEDPEADPFKAMAKHRRILGDYSPPLTRAPDRRLFWIALATPALAIVLVGLASRAAVALRRRHAARRAHPERLARDALREMSRAPEPKDAAAAGERALHHAIEAATRLKSRGVLLEVLPDELRKCGIEEPLIEEVQATLSECATLRFDPTASSERGDELSLRVKKTVKALLGSEPEEVAA